MKTKSFFIVGNLLLYALYIFLPGCIAPRSVTDSGKVTPKHQIKVGGSYSANVPTQTIKNVAEVVGASENVVELIGSSVNSNKNTEELINTVNNSQVYTDECNILTKCLLVYSIDPLTTGINYYARYGLLNRVDVGYQYAAGTHAFDAKYQFLGSTGEIGSNGGKKIYGSIGLQYSSHDYALPLGLDKIQGLLGLDLKRKDFFIPLVFSTSFGPEEKIGHFSWGLAYNYTLLEYGFNPSNAIKNQINLPFSPMYYKKNFSSFGTFINVKVGYKYVYFLTSLSAYYQNYGNFTMLDGSQAHFSGFTFVPSMGLQVVIPPWDKIKKHKREQVTKS